MKKLVIMAGAIVALAGCVGGGSSSSAATPYVPTHCWAAVNPALRVMVVQQDPNRTWFRDPRGTYRLSTAEFNRQYKPIGTAPC